MFLFFYSIMWNHFLSNIPITDLIKFSSVIPNKEQVLPKGLYCLFTLLVPFTDKFNLGIQLKLF